MLTLVGEKHRYCDGLTRRGFLQLGGLAMGGLGLPALSRAEEAAGIRRSHKAIIMVYLSGGLAHLDSFDLKPDAPDEVRGEFKPIDTRVPGVQICELLPMTAACLDKICLIRSIVGLRDEHSSFQNLTGRTMDVSKREGWPHFGSAIARLQRSTNGTVPPSVDLFPTMQHRPYNSPGPGFLGHAFAPVKADGEDLASMSLRYIPHEQLAGRRRLLDHFDGFRRAVESSEMDQMDAAYRRAFEVLTSSKLVEAMDLEREETSVRERYGRGSPKHQGDGAPLWNDQLLMARRLVEAGVRCVTVAFGFWDTHGNNFGHLKQNLPLFDRGVSALVEDLHQRGLAEDVSLVVWGEFGRTPKINKEAGRDHWAPVNGCLLAGGGMRTGQVIGSTDKLAAAAASRPVHYQDVLATVYQRLGIDPHTFVQDITGRPIALVSSQATPIRELV
ncbi:MAG TPA: DUF1501 domain-containing protein [Pirellulales bacterium]|jgi:hypothetical protein|nr:DUF1501 domain-containing protein [Pirellulales bacterium]